MRVLNALLVATLLLSTSGALPGARDDDAGSGRDAPGTGEGLFIVPGTYTGRLTTGIDDADHYAFDAAPGDIVSVSFSADNGPSATPIQMLIFRPDDGSLLGGVGPSGLHFAPDAAGRWSLHVEGEGAASYRWTLGISHHLVARTVVSRDPWVTVEVVQSASGFLFFQVVDELPTHTGNPNA